MISDLRIQHEELRVGRGLKNSQFSILNPKFMSIASRLSAALADRYRMEPRLGQEGKSAG